MSALVTSDWHLSSNPKDHYRHYWVGTELPLMIRQHKPDWLLVLGDLTHQKDCHNAELVNDVVTYLEKLARLTQVIIMRGNHDCLNPDRPFFEFVKHIPRIKWISHPHGTNLETLGDCLFLPHTRNYKKDWEFVDFNLWRKGEGWIFAHNTFDGADAGSGRRLRGIPLDVFPKRARVISGDVHVPQILGQVTYAGAPYTVAFGDSYRGRVLHILGNGEMLSLKTSGPQKVVIHIDGPSFDIDLNHGDIVQARVTLKANDYARWNEIKAAVRKRIERQNAIAAEIKPIKANKAVKLNLKRSSSQSDAELLNSYGQRRGVGEDYMKTAHWIMGRV